VISRCPDTFTTTCPERRVGSGPSRGHASTIEPPIEHRDVTTIMALLGDIKGDVREIRMLLEDDNGEEEEAPEADG
jgi:hypothetical protein